MIGHNGISARRFAIDTLIGLAIFSVAMMAIVGGSSPAGAVEANVLAFAESRWMPMLAIGGVFSLVLAFNLALYRHIRHAALAESGNRRRALRQSGH